MDLENSDEFTMPNKCHKIIFFYILILFLVLTIASFFLIFVGFPLVFTFSVTLQQNLVFTHWNLETNKSFFEHYHFPGLKNKYVIVKDIDHDLDLALGFWHILPLELTKIALEDKSYDYDSALKHSNYSVLLYFHGTGEDRSQSQRKYQVLRYFFHVITFDYRSYGDSSKGPLFERNVAYDCLQIYRWLQNVTYSPIYVWGHSLGTALATNIVAQLNENSNMAGLILEAPFTTFSDELYQHPVIKYFTWLPWFEALIVKTLEKNGFVFNTSQHLLHVKCPVMFLHAKDDTIIPYFMSERLYQISQKREIDDHIKNDSMLVLFEKDQKLNHYFIYQDPYFIFHIYEFLKKTSNFPLNI